MSSNYPEVEGHSVITKDTTPGQFSIDDLPLDHIVRVGTKAFIGFAVNDEEILLYPSLAKAIHGLA